MLQHRARRRARPLRLLLAALGLAAGAPPAARAGAQAAIKVNDSVSVRFGVLLQPWYDTQQDAANGKWAQNMYLRRARLLVGGQITKRISFFLETDNPNLGRSSGTPTNRLGAGFILQDAFVDWKHDDALSVQTGLMLPAFCRNCLQSAASLLTLDYGSYSFLNGSVEQNIVGRDVGVQVKGYVAKGRLEYRAGVFDGQRAAPPAGGTLGANNALRLAGRLQLALLDKEATAYFYPAQYFGRRRMLNVGAAIDEQQTLRTYAADVFFDHPAGDGAVTLQADYFHRDPGKNSAFAALRQQDDLFVEGGFLLPGKRLQPFARYETQNYAGTGVVDQDRFQVGTTIFYAGPTQNTHLKLAYSRVQPQTGRRTGEFTLQGQFFYY